MRAIAIDFETANERRDSACAIGLAWIDDGRVSRREYRLIRPPEMRFHPGNIRVHGIVPHDVAHEPEFPDIWREFAGDVGERMFLAHNASFDSAVLAGMLACYGMPALPLKFACTLQMARRAWPELPRHSLNAVSSFLGVDFQHHHAGEDAFACAQVALAALREVGEAAFEPARARTPRRATAGRATANAATLARANDHPATPFLTPAMLARSSGRMGAPVGTRTGNDFTAPSVMVRGSKGDAWRVQVGVGAGARTSCNCPAGRFGRLCRHVKALADGVVDDVIACENVDLAEALRQIRKQTG